MKFIEVVNNNLENVEKIIFLEYDNSTTEDIEKKVFEIGINIKKDGFKALQEYTLKFDNFNITEQNLRVKREEIEKLSSKIDNNLDKALKVAIKRVFDFHKREKEKGFVFKDKEGNKMGQKVVPLESVGVYIPGGRALYPSTIYMTIIPAIIAGVKRIVVVSPPRTFVESVEVARVLEILNIDEIYRIGGAQSIFSLAYGVQGIKPVDKIVGPGNIYVTKAKQIVYGKVDIDMIAGPSEIMIIVDSDKESDIEIVAMDMLSQAEHDPMARAIIIGKDKEYLNKIVEKAYSILESLPENLKENAKSSLDKNGLAIVCNSDTTIVDVVNIVAPEHLEIFSKKPDRFLKGIRNCGSVFLGRWTPESVGDYLGGPNHVLPTLRTARFYSPLGVYDFQKRFSFIEFNKNSLRKYYKDISILARKENLEAHARSTEIRFKE
ncbi:MAG TPA: histidinol dehydrogenase [Spirochaetota bacterium]|nr:histidinol dehydrogenase [Spirochaetota bacterium]HOL56223.1 histidinol dehydrogenase [Spirochaetota bacterium]HPP03804.1 histidinol dehydrogenase [Spirochaetota bacterium]